MSTAEPRFQIRALRWHPRRSTPRTERAAAPPLEGRVVPAEPVLLGVEEAARCLGVGRTTVFELLRLGRLKSVRIGRRRLIPREELEVFARRRADQEAR